VIRGGHGCIDVRVKKKPYFRPLSARSMIEPAMKLACHLQILCVAIRGPTADSL
jgi:hypothetical protein